MKLSSAAHILLLVTLLFVLAASAPKPSEKRKEPDWRQWVSLRDWRSGMPTPRGRGRRSHPQVLMEQAALGVGDFAIRLYRSLAYRKTNLLLPPLALYTALASTMTAARSRTLGELKTRLRAHGRSDTLPFAMHQLSRALRPDRVSTVSMETATAVFRQDETCLRPPFLARMKRFYGAEVVSPGPKGDGLSAWVEQQTQGTLAHAAKGLVDSRVAMAFLTSLRLRAPWNSAFRLVRPHQSSFFNEDRLQGRVQMLSTTGYFQQGRSDALGCRVLELPYRGHQVALYIFMPETPGGLRALDAAITHNGLEAAIASLTLDRQSKILVALPKIKLRARMNLKKALKSMGIRKMFQQTQADLSGIDGTRDLYVTDVCTGSKVEDVDIGEVMAAARRPKDGILKVDSRNITHSTAAEVNLLGDFMLVDEDKTNIFNFTKSLEATGDDASHDADGKSAESLQIDLPQRKTTHEIPQKESSNVDTLLNDVPIDSGVYDSHYPALQHSSRSLVRIPLITTDVEDGARKEELDPTSQTVHKVKVEIIPSQGTGNDAGVGSRTIISNLTFEVHEGSGIRVDIEEASGRGPVIIDSDDEDLAPPLTPSPPRLTTPPPVVTPPPYRTPPQPPPLSMPPTSPPQHYVMTPPRQLLPTGPPTYQPFYPWTTPPARYIPQWWIPRTPSPPPPKRRPPYTPRPPPTFELPPLRRPLVQPPYFIVNRPFMFLIRHKKTKVYLFMGKYADTRKERSDR